MIRLRMLGGIDVWRDDERVEAVLRQPKRFALLAYLATSSDAALRRRDLVVAIFWPEADGPRARDSLSAALSFLRRRLGADALLSRGDEEIGVDPRQVRSDVAEFLDAIEEGRHEEALSLYAGDLLHGFHVPGVPEFEQWLERERSRIRTLAVNAASTLTDRAAAAAGAVHALQYARRAAELEPNDERLIRRLISLLDAAGDRAGALRMYETFVASLWAEYGAEPAAETKSLGAALHSPSNRLPVSHVDRAARSSHESSSAAVDADSFVAHADARSPQTPARSLGMLRRLRGLRVGASLTLLAGAITFASIASDSAKPDIAPDDTILAQVAGSAASDVRGVMGRLLLAALEQGGVLIPVREDDVRQGLRSMLRPDTQSIDRTIALELGYRGAIRTVVEPTLDRVGDTFALTLRVIDVETGKVVATEGTFATGDDELIPAAYELVRRLYARLGGHRAELAAARPALEATTSSFAAYRKLVRAALVSGPERENLTRPLLREAIALDPTFAMAWARLATSWANSGNRDSMLAAIRVLETLADRGSEREQLQHRVVIATSYGDYGAALPLYDRLVRDYGPAELNNRGLTLYALGRIDESIGSTWAAIERRRFGPPAPAVGNLRNLLVIVGRPADAKRITDSLIPLCGTPCDFLKGEQKWFTILLDEWTQAESLAAIYPRAHARASVKARRGEIAAAARDLEAAPPGERFHTPIAQLLLTLVTGRPWERFPTHGRGSSVDSLVWLGLWNAVAGDTIVARTSAAALQRVLPGQYRGAAPEFVDAAIAARGGRWREVIDVLGPVDARGERGRLFEAGVTPLPIRWMLAQAYDRLDMLDSATAMYERVLWPGGGFMQSMILRGIPVSFAHQRLAVLYARMERREDAMRHYQKFSAAFNRPDPEYRHLLDEAGNAMKSQVMSVVTPGPP